LKTPVEGKKTKILLPENSAPHIAVIPEIVVAANPVVTEAGVGMGHSWKLLAAGSRYPTLLPEASTNQQQLPVCGSNVRPVGALAGVGIVHSVSV
jgi:hypothetical protein